MLWLFSHGQAHVGFVYAEDGIDELTCHDPDAPFGQHTSASRLTLNSLSPDHRVPVVAYELEGTVAAAQREFPPADAVGLDQPLDRPEVEVDRTWK